MGNSIYLHAGRLEIQHLSLFYLISAVVVSPVVEEIAFRGVILQVLQGSMRGTDANAAAAVRFLRYHLPLWLERGQGISLMGCLWVLFFATWMGWALSRSKSLRTSQNFLFGIL